MKKRKWFTLIEILIVIIIIWIMLAIGFSLNWNSVDQLRAKSSIEEISSFFDTKFLQTQASNYENWVAYTWIDITLSLNATSIPYVYHLSWNNSEGNFYWENFTITSISWATEVDWGKTLETVTIQYVPFSPGCEFIWGDGTEMTKIYFSAKPRGLKEACFELDKNYCKLKAIRCPWDKY